MMEELWRIKDSLTFAEGSQILKFPKRNQGPGEHVSSPHLIQSRTMVNLGPTWPVEIDILPAGKRVLQEKKPSDIDQGGKIGCEKVCWEEVAPVGTYAKNPAEIYKDTRLRPPVFELLRDHQHIEFEKHLSQLV
jgi:hypothetical protein